MYNNKTKAQLIEIIQQKEDEIIELKDDLRKLEKCEIYDDITDEIKAVYDKLVAKGFADTEALEITQTMISVNKIPYNAYNRVSYRPYR
jgi:hypothetical protein